MKKIIMFGLMAIVLLIGAGTTALAHNSNNSGDKNTMFERALPLMKEMHPNLTEQEIKNMYDLCFSDHGQASNATPSINSNGHNTNKVVPNHSQHMYDDCNMEW